MAMFRISSISIVLKRKTDGLRIGLIFLVLELLCLPLLGQENPWEEDKVKEGITVSSRERSSEKTNEFKAQMVVEADLEILVKVIKEASLGTQWVNRAVKFETIDEVDAYEWYSYTEIAIPWPFLNKDLVTHNTLFYDSTGQKVEVQMISEPDYIDEKKGLSRLQHSEGVWVFQELEAGEIQVSYQVFARSSGGLPAWIVNPIIVHGLYVTLRDLKKVVQADVEN